MQLQRVGRGGPGGSRGAQARPPSIPGIALCRALRADGAGPPWRGRDTTTGQDVVLRPLPAALDPSELTSLPDHAHLAVVSLWRDADGRQYTGTELAVHGGLDALVARRGPLTGGETAMVVMAVGRALAALHAAGRVHGSLTMGTVLVDAAMRPQVDTSLCRPVPLSDQECARLATEDVRALGALAMECMGGDVPPALRVVLSAATDPMASLRPSAVELVRTVLAAVPPEGLRLTGHQHSAAAPVVPPRSLGRRRHAGPRRPSGRATAALRPVTLLVALALLAAAVCAGTVWARASQGDEGAPAPAPAPAPATRPATAPAAVDWATVVHGLDVARSAAFANADTTVLASVDAAGSPALWSDLLAVRALASSNVQARDYAVTSSAVRLVSLRPGDAVVTITDMRSAYQLVDATGAVVASQPARGGRTWRVHLVQVAGTWLVHDVSPQPTRRVVSGQGADR